MPSVPRDGCVVPAEPIRELVGHFVAGWNRDRPQPSSGQFGFDSGGVPPVRPLEWLSHEASRLSSIPITESTLQNIITVDSHGVPRRQVIELRVADAVTQALDCPDVLVGIAVMPNPRAKPAARAECCGGSDGALSGSGASC